MAKVKLFGISISVQTTLICLRETWWNTDRLGGGRKSKITA